MGKKSQLRSKGFTLVAALLMLLLMSGIAVGLMYMVNSEAHIGGNDVNYNVAYYSAESGMEKLTADLATLYQSSQAPIPANITNLTNFPPTAMGNMNYTESITWTPDANGNPISNWSTISSGNNYGLKALIVPYTLTVNATQPVSGASANITRSVEVALIPVFQFGIFADGDIDYFAGPAFTFKGRVHTNGSLYLASGSTLALFDKATAFNQIITDRLENNHLTSSGYTGTIFIPNASGGCDVSQPATHCLASTAKDPASWSGGIPPAGGQTGGWVTTSTSTYNGFVSNSVTGVRKLTLPFVGQGVQPIQIIRKPINGELPGTTLNSSRLYTKAQIRVLLADTQADLHPERGPIPDGQDIDLNAQNLGTFPVAGGYNVGGTIYPFAQADTTKDANWIKNVRDPGGTTTWPLFADKTNVAGVQHHTWLRVEYKNAAGNWIGVTTQWLGFGFARDFEPPASAGANPVHPNAILILQELADRNGDGAHNGTDGMLTAASEKLAYNYYPINLYDDREGHPRDTNLATAANCNINGIMNAVEIDVGNLRRWLGRPAANGAGVIAGSGTQVDFVQQNGYVLYFSDRRGMVPSPNTAPQVTTGEYGFEDVINSGSAAGAPDGGLEAPAASSPEDVNQNLILDAWGANDVGDGFGLDFTLTNPRNPYQPVNCGTIGRANRVTGARHVLKLIDGTLGNLPTRLDNPTPPGGFTVASENPVYVQGDYNASTGAGFGDPHAAASIIADAVTLLSNQWSDSVSLKNPNNLGGRVGNTSWYRMAIAAGKTLAFPQPVWGGQDMGTDGGMHNFLRYLESWGGTLNYEGSLVSLYSSQYATGVFKCCTTVYNPPTRAYQFDQLFLQPQNLPPATPMFQDVDNLSYHQNFTPQ
jgi:Tfp pilus assembly protein PilX